MCNYVYCSSCGHPRHICVGPTNSCDPKKSDENAVKNYGYEPPKE